VIARLTKISQDEDACLGDYAAAVELDPNVAARVLRVVNSAYFALPQKIVDVQRAVTFLGTEEVSRVALAVAVVRGLSTASRQLVQRHWHHAVHVALASRHTARILAPDLSPDESWTAGLLHDVGKLVFAALFDEHAVALDRFARLHGMTHASAEVELGYPSHARLGMVLCERWRLPSLIARVIAGAHAGSDDPVYVNDHTRGYIRVVAVSDILVQLAEGDLAQPAIETLRAELKEQLGDDQTQLLKIASAVNDLGEEARALADMLTST